MRRVARHFLAETMLLAILAGALGIVLGAAGVSGLIRAAPADIPRLGKIGVDASVLAFAGCLVALIALLLAIFRPCG